MASKKKLRKHIKDLIAENEQLQEIVRILIMDPDSKEAAEIRVDYHIKASQTALLMAAYAAKIRCVFPSAEIDDSKPLLVPDESEVQLNHTGSYY